MIASFYILLYLFGYNCILKHKLYTRKGIIYVITAIFVPEKV